MTVYGFDRDGTLMPFGGPVPFPLLRQLQQEGHLVGTLGGAEAREQTSQWREHGVAPDFALSKGDLGRLPELFPGQDLVQVDDDVSARLWAPHVRRRFMTPAQFMAERQGQAPPAARSYRELVAGYRRCLQELHRAPVPALVELLRQCRGTVWTAGNGGSASTASHFVADLVRAGVPAACLNDNPALVTGLANDVGYPQALAYLARLFRPEDVLVVISGSGNSQNLVGLVEVARQQGIRTIGLLGFGGGRLQSLCDLSVVLKSSDYGEVEGVHSCLCHLIPQLLKEDIACRS